MELMRGLISRLNKELRKAKAEEQQQAIIAKYAAMSAIQTIAYGSVYTVEDMIKNIENKVLSHKDGYAFYWDSENKKETDVRMSFNIDKIKEKAYKYEYIIWHIK